MLLDSELNFPVLNAFSLPDAKSKEHFRRIERQWYFAVVVVGKSSPRVDRIQTERGLCVLLGGAIDSTRFDFLTGTSTCHIGHALARG